MFIRVKVLTSLEFSLPLLVRQPGSLAIRSWSASAVAITVASLSAFRCRRTAKSDGAGAAVNTLENCLSVSPAAGQLTFLVFPLSLICWGSAQKIKEFN